MVGSAVVEPWQWQQLAGCCQRRRGGGGSSSGAWGEIDEETLAEARAKVAAAKARAKVAAAKARAKQAPKTQAKAGPKKRRSNRGNSQNAREFGRWKDDHNELQKLRHAHEQLKDSEQSAQGELWSMQIERQILEEELTELHQQKDAAETEAARIRAELEQAKAELSQRKESLDSLCLAYQDLDAQCQGMQMQLTMTRASCEAVAAENKALFEKQLQECKNEQQRLQKEWTENEKSLREDFVQYKAGPALLPLQHVLHRSIHHQALLLAQALTKQDNNRLAQEVIDLKKKKVGQTTKF